MRRWLTALALGSVLAIAIPNVALAAPEGRLDPGEGFDIATFFDLSGDGVADANNPVTKNTPWLGVYSEDGFNCSISGDTSCNLSVTGGKQVVKIKANRSNGIGDVGIRREFVASPGEYYAAAATVEIVNVNLTDGSNLWARLTVVGSSLSGSQANPECNTTIKLSKDLGSNPDPVVEVLEIPNCLLATGTQKVHIKVRLHSNSYSSGGTMIINNVSFRRCLNTGCLPA